MNTNILVTASALSDQDLLARLEGLAGKEREASAELVAHLAALDSRPVALRRSRLRLALQLLHPGPSALRGCRLQPHRRRSGLPALPADPRSPGFGLLEPDLRPPAGTAPHGGEPRVRPREGQGQDAARNRSAGRRAGAATRPSEHRAKGPLPHGDTIRRWEGLACAWPCACACGLAWPAPGPAMTSVPSAAGAAIAPSPSALPATPRPIVQASAPERYRVQFTIGQETHEKLRRLQALLRREIPDGDPGAIFDRALTVLLEKVEKTKLAAAAKPRPSRPIRPADGSKTRLSVPRRIRKSANPACPPAVPPALPPCAARPALPHCAAGGQARGLAARRWPVRLRVLHRKEMHGEHVPGVPPHPALCEAGAGHRRQHLPSLLAPQPVRGRADLRPAWPVDRP